MSPAAASQTGYGLHGLALRVYHQAEDGKRTAVNIPMLAPATVFPAKDVHDMYILFKLGSVSTGKMGKAGAALGNAGFLKAVNATFSVAEEEQKGRGPFGWMYASHMAFHFGRDYVKYRLVPRQEHGLAGDVDLKKESPLPNPHPNRDPNPSPVLLRFPWH